jgi:alkylation response protein AidB-like acyl-CoA dehydrogenase/SAM-dependent methyltransferase
MTTRAPAHSSGDHETDLVVTAGALGLPTALARIAERADRLDRAPHFPHENFADLAAAGVVGLAADRDRCNLVREIELVRAVAAADAATARILDGHFNGAERLAICGEPTLATRELEFVRSADALIGVWGADPSPSEGEPARIVAVADGSLRLRGVKVFCSGAGGVQRAIVLARDDAGARRLAYVDPRVAVEIDTAWFRGSGLRSSESHRVVFRDTPVISLLGGPDELTREPWFSRDAVRTTATWAGIADCLFDATITALAGTEADDARLLGLGGMRVARAVIDRSLDHAAGALPAPPAHAETGERNDGAAAIAGECRIAVAAACRSMSADAARLCGSRGLVGGGPLDRCRRDLDLFLQQHRLEPRLIALGAQSLAAAAKSSPAPDEAQRFERLYAADRDPWSYDSSAYERDKRAATLAALPPPPIGTALDLGCSNGALTSLLARRCEAVVAVDLSARAVALAGERRLPANVALVQARFPDETPDGEFDLIVCSEVLYYLTPAELWRAVRWLRSRLRSGATLLAVSWRGHGDEPMRGEDVHDLLAQELAPWHALDARQPGYRIDRFDGVGDR